MQWRAVLSMVCLGLLCTLAGPALAKSRTPPPAQNPASPSAQDPPPPPHQTQGASSADSQGGWGVPQVSATGVPLRIANRGIFVFHATLLGEPPDARAARAKAVIEEVLQGGVTDLEVTIRPILKSYIVLLGERRGFFVTPADVLDSAEPAAVEQAARAAAENLREVVAATRESRNVAFMLRALGYSSAATLLLYLLVRGIDYVRGKLLASLTRLMDRHARALKVSGKQLLDTHQLYAVVSVLINLLRWSLLLLLCYEWLGFVLSQFPYTRPWGDELNTYLLVGGIELSRSVINAVPGLGVALAIFFIARGAAGFSRRLLQRLASPGPADSWLTPETLGPTTRLVSLAIWLFALAMAYPYLPGSGTEAFKGLSVLIGLMVSLGASSVVGQAASGLILTYTHTLRPGEYIRVGEHEGTVTDLGMFTTRLRTGLGEVLTIPNSMITGTVTKNYSRTVSGPGYVVDTTVTIGYDTPWRQVEAMLIEAAGRTPGILASPPPRVFQTALSDFYPAYRLVAQAVPSEPLSRAELMTRLLANIQDVFNEYGVQIMSPHYIADPADAKVVPPDAWYAAPARPPGDTLPGR